VAYDAVTLIVNKKNPDSTLLYNKVKEIFTGKINTWKQMDQKSTLTDSISVIFDNNGSGIPVYKGKIRN